MGSAEGHLLLERGNHCKEKDEFKSSRVGFNNLTERKFLGKMEVTRKCLILERKYFNLKLEERMHLYQMAFGSSKIKYWPSLERESERMLR